MFNNLEYLYNHLPSRFRRDDDGLFLKRFLQFFGETLDDYDEIFDTFFEKIQPETVSEEWLEFWLETLFGWSWFPSWFTLEQKRNLYANFARHLARRGTARGIELWLADFRITARVHTKPAFYGEFCYGEGIVAVSEPLIIPIEILSAAPNQATDICVTGEGCYGEQFVADYAPLFTTKELADLLLYQQPLAQEILLMPRRNFAVSPVDDEVSSVGDGSYGEAFYSPSTYRPFDGYENYFLRSN